MLANLFAHPLAYLKGAWQKQLTANPLSPQASRLYQLAVSAARTPYLYQASGAKVADTVDGRFDATCLMVVVLVWRLRMCGMDGRMRAQEVVDTMFADMEASLLALGVGENSIGKKIRPLASAFGGRMRAYMGGLDGGDEAVLARALIRNLYRRDDSQTDAELCKTARTLAKQIAMLQEGLRILSDTAVLDGKLTWQGLASRVKKRYKQFSL